MLKLALPTGELRGPTADMLAAAGIGNDEYAGGSRSLRLPLDTGAEAMIRVFRERDIPIQIALGNYDVGVCGLTALEELRLRFPQDEIALLRPLAFGAVEVWVATDPVSVQRLGTMAGWSRYAGLRIVSDLPALAETFALTARLSRARVIAVLGSAEAYPPEDADLAILEGTEGRIRARGLVPLHRLLSGSAWLIANRRSLAERDLSSVLRPLLAQPYVAPDGGHLSAPRLSASGEMRRWDVPARSPNVVRLAIPDGHQQRHAVESLLEAGLHFDGYSATDFVRRPASGVEGLEVKVIRPQDMPQQVALGNFDLAMTGRDVLHDHLLAFPSSPVEEVVDLRRSRYGIAAVVDGALPASTIAEALAVWRSAGRTTIRIASEYPNIADQYARSRRFGRYRVLPIAGASEGFVPEDAEVLIEGSETGKSIVANNLKIVDAVFDSTNCLIAGKRRLAPQARELADRIVAAFRTSIEQTVAG